MRLVTFRQGTVFPKAGVLVHDDRAVVDLAAAHELLYGQPLPYFETIMALIEGGVGALDVARRIVEQPPEEAVHGRDDVKFLSPVPTPRRMRDYSSVRTHVGQVRRIHFRKVASRALDPEVALARFRAHGLMDSPRRANDFIHYKCNSGSVVGADADVVWPRRSHLMDYEMELGVFIARRGMDIPADRARDYIFGYTIFNDMSARDTPIHETMRNIGLGKAKDFDTGNVLGPCLVTADEIPDPYNLAMTVRVNDEETWRGNSSLLNHRFEDIIAYASRGETLYAGDFMACDTVEGGTGLELGRHLGPDDVIELEIEGIGVLRNRLVRLN